MKKFKSLVWLFLFCLITFFSYGQSQPNSLLWRISGNGLKGSSYLYGTIHLNDERVFNLGDSLYKAIELSDGFAMELDPDQLTSYIVDMVKDKILHPKKLNTILSKKDFDQYGTALADKFHKNKDDLTTEDIFKEKNKWINEKFRTGKMETFLDVYLFGLAKKQGKWTGGVEELQDQMNLGLDAVDKSDVAEVATTNNNDNSKKYLEKMIVAYEHSDMNFIADNSYTGDSLSDDRILTQRNIRMAAKMDTLSHQRTMVFAVGAAHLPGNRGIIALLQKKGFTVVPVFSSRKIKPEEYVVKEIPQEWITINDEHNFYQASMPGKTQDIILFDFFRMKVNFDLLKSSGYFTTAMPYPLSASESDSTIIQMRDRIFQKGAAKNAKPITINGATGMVYMRDDQEGFRKGFILRRNNMIYIAIGSSLKADPDRVADIDRFLQSFVIPDENKNSSALVYHYHDSTKAFELDLPAQPQYMKEYGGINKKEGIHSVPYLSIDITNGIYYFFGTNTILPGRYIKNDSTQLAGIEQNTKSKMDKIFADTIMSLNDNRYLTMEGTASQNTQLRMKCFYIIRGNRWYSLVAMFNPEKPHPQVDAFFDSFHLLDFPKINWRQSQSADSLVSTWSPAPIASLERDSTEKTIDHIYNTNDSISSRSFDIVCWHKYSNYWSISDSAFWSEYIKGKITEPDSLIYKKPVVNGEATGWEIEYQQPGSYLIVRERFLRNGDELCTLLNSQTQSGIREENTNRFFEDFRFLKTKNNSTLFTSHAGQLLNDLFDKDSVIATEAYDYLSKAPFSKYDLDTLFKALNRTNICHEIFLSPGDLSRSIVLAINKLKETASIKMAAGYYQAAVDSNIELKNALLKIICSSPRLENYQMIQKLMVASPPSKGLSSEVIYSLSDSMELLKSISTDLLPLLKTREMQGSIIRICKELIDSDQLTRQLLTPYFPECIQFAKIRIDELIADSSNSTAVDLPAIRVLGFINTPLANAQLQRFLLIRDHWYNYYAVTELLKNKQSVNSKTISSLAADKTYRYRLYDILNDHHQTALFPANYKTSKQLAESCIWNDGSDDDESIDSIHFITQKSLPYKGKTAIFYFFKISFDSAADAPWYLACSGPYFQNSILPADPDQTSHFYYEEPYDPKKINSQIKTLMKKYQ